MNNCVFIGNLVSDPETKKIKDNVVSEFRLAIEDPYNNGKEIVKNTCFHDFQAWGEFLTSIISSAKKGQKLLVVAAARVETWEKDGEKRSKTRFRVKEVGVCSKPNNSGKQSSNNTESQSQPKEEEIPF